MIRNIIPTYIGFGTIVVCFLLAIAFIFLSTQKFENEITVNNQNTQKNWLRDKTSQIRHQNITFRYDTRQASEMHIVYYNTVLLR